MRTTRGFTLIELLIVIGISMLLLGTGIFYLGNTNKGLRVTQAADKLVTVLRTAQQRSATQEEGYRWGVYINNLSPTDATFTLFSVDETLLLDPMYIGAPGTTTEYTALPNAVRFTAPAAPTTTSIIFNKGTGAPTASTTLTLETASPPTTSRSITIEANGRIDLR